jgi:16S rRNA (guanine966-N2)-methyltransferase
MTRLVGGRAGGRRLVVPAGRGTRPTSDRAREALFSTLHAERGSLDGSRFLDLYAGSGAVGLEALSRGAAHVLLVESAVPALTALRANVAAVGLPGALVFPVPVERLADRNPDGGPYDVVFADPPYAVGGAALGDRLEGLAGRGWLTEGALVVVERPARAAAFDWPTGFVPLKDRRYGDTRLGYGLWYGHPADRSKPEKRGQE